MICKNFSEKSGHFDFNRFVVIQNDLNLFELLRDLKLKNVKTFEFSEQCCIQPLELYAIIMAKDADDKRHQR